MLRELTLFMVRRVASDEAEKCLEEVQNWMNRNLPPNYSWPGNYRELEQCVRNVIIRGTYQPVVAESVDAMDNDGAAGFFANFRAVAD